MMGLVENVAGDSRWQIKREVGKKSQGFLGWAGNKEDGEG